MITNNDHKVSLTDQEHPSNKFLIRTLTANNIHVGLLKNGYPLIVYTTFLSGNKRYWESCFFTLGADKSP